MDGITFEGTLDSESACAFMCTEEGDVKMEITLDEMVEWTVRIWPTADEHMTGASDE